MKKQQTEPEMKPKAVVMFSGGQDSTTVLAVAIDTHGADNVYPLSFNYGQRHVVELRQASLILDKWGVRPAISIDLKDYGLACVSALTGTGSVSERHRLSASVPASFVPGRNAIMFAIAHGLAQSLGAGHVYGGQCETDYSGYPDCRQDFVISLQVALNLGRATKEPVKFHTPLMHLTKAQTFGLANQCGRLNDVIELSHTCYEGDRTKRHEWGYGCGVCPACELRAKGYMEYVSN
jgi:7-cyano-7-deazaguanine synthase